MSLPHFVAEICRSVYSFLQLNEYVRLASTSRYLRDISTHQGSCHSLCLKSCTRLGPSSVRFRPRHLTCVPLGTIRDLIRVAEIASVEVLSLRHASATGTYTRESLNMAPLTNLSRLHTLYCNFPPHVICIVPSLRHHFGALANLALTSCSCKSVCDMAGAPSLQTLSIETVVHLSVCHKTLATWPEPQTQKTEWDYLIERVCTCLLLREFAMDGYTILPPLDLRA